MPTAQKKETKIETLKDVIFMYSSVSRPMSQLNTDKKPPLSATTSPTFHLEFHSYEIKILVSEARFKKLKKDDKTKGAKNFPNADEFTKEELIEKYDYLNPDDLADDMVQIKFSQTCLVGKPNADGVRRESYAVKQIGVKGQVQDMNGLTIDHETSIGNGTKGHFQFRPVDGDNGRYLYPHLLCITELVEYIAEAEEDLDSLGLEDLDETDLDALGLEEPEAAEEAAEEVPATEGELVSDDELDEAF